MFFDENNCTASIDCEMDETYRSLLMIIITVRCELIALQRRLKDEMVHLGEVDLVLEEVSGFLQQTEYDLQQLDDIYGDPRFIETHLKNVQVTRKPDSRGPLH